MPTGAGEIRPLPAEGLTDFYWARWFPDGRRILVVASDADAIPRSYIQDFETGKLEPIGEKGMLAVLPSPEGRSDSVQRPAGIVSALSSRRREAAADRGVDIRGLADSVEPGREIPLSPARRGRRAEHLPLQPGQRRAAAVEDACAPRSRRHHRDCLRSGRARDDPGWAGLRLYVLEGDPGACFSARDSRG